MLLQVVLNPHGSDPLNIARAWPEPEPIEDMKDLLLTGYFFCVDLSRKRHYQTEDDTDCEQ